MKILLSGRTSVLTRATKVLPHPACSLSITIPDVPTGISSPHATNGCTSSSSAPSYPWCSTYGYPVVRPLVPIVAPSEKPQTTVYVGKIAPTVDNEFLLSLLKLCGPVKRWKRAQDPSDGTPKGFGFCEFEAAEGILRAMRLMSKLSIDGQELVEEADKIKAAGKAWYKTMISGIISN